MATNGCHNISKDNTSKGNIIKDKVSKDSSKENEVSDNSQILSSATADKDNLLDSPSVFLIATFIIILFLRKAKS